MSSTNDRVGAASTAFATALKCSTAFVTAPLRLVRIVLVSLGGDDPEVVAKASIGAQITSMRMGLQVALGAAIPTFGVYMVLRMQFTGPVATSYAMAGALMAGGIAAAAETNALQRLHQMEAEREAARNGFRSRIPGNGLVRRALMLLTRLGMAVVGNYFYASIFLAVMLAPEIATQKAEDAALHNRPIVAVATAFVDGRLASLRGDSVTKRDAYLTVLAKPPAPPSDDPSARLRAPIDTEITTLASQLQAARQQRDAVAATLAGLRTQLSCEEDGKRCGVTNSTQGLSGKGPNWRLINNLIRDNQVTADGLDRRITALLDERTALFTRRDMMIRQVQVLQDTALRASAAALEREIGAARAAATAAAAAFTNAFVRRAADIQQESERRGFLPPEVGISSDIAAMTRIEARPDRGWWMGLLKWSLVMMELNALLAAFFWPVRRLVPVKEYIPFVIGAEEAAFDANRTRASRPPLEAYGPSRGPIGGHAR